MRITRFWVTALTLPLVLLAAPSTAPAAVATTGPTPFGHACALESYGVRFCPSANLASRVPSFDGAPLDVDVTLPATGTGPWPTIIMAPPTLGSKATYETTNPDGTVGVGPQYSNVWYADQGYAVVTYSMRGTFNSCGTLQSRQGYPACNPVQFQFGDQRYDARDAQYLLGSLVDQGIANPDALGMTGLSLGSIATLEVALLKNRVRLPNGTYAAWKSAAGTPLHLSAAYTTASIGDVLDAAVPNGRFLSYNSLTASNDHSPIGVIKLSFAGVFALGTDPAQNYWDIPEGPNSFDLPGEVAVAEASPTTNPAVASFAQQIHDYHQAIGIPLTTTPAPMLIQDGWDDVAVDGAAQALRVANYVKAAHGNVALQLLDWGHPLALNKPADILLGEAQGTAFFNHYLQGAAGGPAPGSVTASTATCPATAPSGGPFTAQGMDGLNPGAVRFSSAPAQNVFGTGNLQLGVELDWAAASAGIGGACQPFPSGHDTGTAAYTRFVSKTFTMLGLPTMHFTVKAVGVGGQLDARLWDVAPNGTQTFVSRGTYALTNNQTGAVTWQMWGGGHTFLQGHTVRMEILAQDAPTERPSLANVSASISNFTVEIPAHEAPDGGEIVTPTYTGGW
jgi:hypothetical protein